LNDSERGFEAVSERRFVHQRNGVDRRAPRALAHEEGKKAVERRTKERRSGRDRRDDASWQLVSIDDDASASFDAEVTLVTAATDARTRAQAPYSNFMVGAALETSDGVVIGGCNIENATYGLTLCAERVALVKALSDGHSIFTRIAVVADTEAPTPPCGPCRQLLWEYCGDIDIILGNLNGPTGRFRLSALLPMPFDRRLLG
jgi:cytidine deaminase